MKPALYESNSFRQASSVSLGRLREVRPRPPKGQPCSHFAVLSAGTVQRQRLNGIRMYDLLAPLALKVFIFYLFQQAIKKKKYLVYIWKCTNCKKAESEATVYNNTSCPTTKGSKKIENHQNKTKWGVWVWKHISLLAVCWTPSVWV